MEDNYVLSSIVYSVMSRGIIDGYLFRYLLLGVVEVPPYRMINKNSWYWYLHYLHYRNCRSHY